ncbi:MAG: ribbon-helix-helix protein, CopG family [Bryobacteraceae bacterium]|nr:ribbon-helix-helix protein, CopG family [Bryobacteraceae bacterium]
MPQLTTIQVVLEPDLLKAADRAAKRLKRNRSAFFRDAVRAHLRQLATLEAEERDRRGYASSAATEETAQWEREAVWPER